MVARPTDAFHVASKGIHAAFLETANDVTNPNSVIVLEALDANIRDQFLMGNTTQGIGRNAYDGVRMAYLIAEAAENEQKERDSTYLFLFALEQQIQDWKDEIKDIDRELNEVNTELVTVQELLDLSADGELDLADPDVRKKLEELGIDPDLSPEQIETKLKEREKHLLGKKEALEARRSRLEEKISKAEVLVADIQSKRALEISSDGSRFTNPLLEKARQDLGINIRDGITEDEWRQLKLKLLDEVSDDIKSNEADSTISNVKNLSSLDSGQIIEKLSGTFSIEDRGQRLRAQYELVSGLSEDQISDLKFDCEDDKILSVLNDGYFDELKVDGGVVLTSGSLKLATPSV